jgi:hypothetical protein
MIDNTITLSVDVANDSNPADKVYTRFDEFANRSVYNGPDHDLSGNRDICTINRTTPNKNGNFRGTGKTSVKFTRDVEVDGVDTTTSLQVPAIIEVSTSFPIGMTAAERMSLRQFVVSLLDNDTLIDRIHGQLEY